MPTKNKIFALTALLLLAADIFKADEIKEVVFATSDGQFFPNENVAKLHAKSNKLAVHKIERDKAMEALDKADAKKKTDAEAKKVAADAKKKADAEAKKTTPKRTVKKKIVPKTEELVPEVKAEETEITEEKESEETK